MAPSPSTALPTVLRNATELDHITSPTARIGKQRTATKVAGFCNLLKSCQVKMDTWRSDTGDDDGEVVDLLSVDDYDAYKAKVQASLSWVLHKAYEDQVPQEFINPFYERGEGSWQIKPRLANLLANSELYCQACRNMFGENASQWQGHWSIIQVLSRKGIYAVGTGSVDVTETILMQTSPFKIKAHIALIDALMLAFSREIITIERVTQCVRRFTTFNASSELPSDLEDAILFWINKVCVTVQQNVDKTQTGPDGSDTSQKDPMATPRGISVPVMENFMADVGDGCCLAVLLSFYCPQIVKLEDVYLQSIVGIADSLYNLRLIRSFCDKYIPNKTCHFTYEDMLYTKQPLKENFLVMVSELFYWFEIRPLSVVTGGKKVVTPVSGEGDGQQPLSTGKQQSYTSVKVPNVPISSITKQSFQRLKGDSELRSSSTPDIHRMSPSAPVAHRAPLLHKRHQQGHAGQHEDHGLHAHVAGVHRAHSLTSKDLKPGTVPRESVLAWQDRGHPDDLKQEVPSETVQSGSNLLANVSIDSEMNGSFSSGSIDLGDLEPTPRTDRTDQTYTKPTPENVIQFSLQNQLQIPQDFNKQQTPYPGDMQIESVTSERSDAHSVVSGTEELQRGDNSNELTEEFDSRGVNQVEPLMPARLKPLKEKSNISTKEEERGDDFPKKKVPSPPQLKKAVGFNPEIETIDKSVEISRSDSTVSDGQITPLPEDQISPRDSFTIDPQSFHVDNQGLNNVAGKPGPKKFEAFFIRGSLTESQDTSIASHRSDLDDAFVKESFTVPDQIHTPEAARAAGIPIIDSSEHPLLLRQTSREGSIGSSRSSGDFSDHESRKIHFDHKTRESAKIEPGNIPESSHVNIKSPGQYIIQKPVIVNRRKEDDKNIKANATNFAAIKQLKDLGTVDNSGLIYMQHGQEKEGPKSPLKEALQKNKAVKKTTFAPLPNQRTWGQSVATNNQNQESAVEASDPGTASQELLKIKMKLEEKRKAIERKKHTQEIQQQKMRQRLGKAAFMHVIAKPKEEEEDDLENEGQGRRPTSLVPSRMTTSDPQVQVEPRVSKTPERNVMNTSDSAKQVAPRRFSRDDIQQTIENVKTKWFNGDDSVSSRIQNEKLSQQRTESPERSRTRRSLSVESREPEVSQRISPKREPEIEGNPDESYGEYNNSLDKLNQSLTDLQGEIMRLSLKQKQSGQPIDKMVNNDINRQNRNDNSVNGSVRSNTPPNVLEVRSKDESPRSVQTSRPRGVRSSSEPRQIMSEQVPEEQIGNYQSQTLPRQFQPNQVSPYMMQGHVAGPAGPVYSNPNQFVPVPSGTGMVPTPQQYGSYLMGPSPGQMGQIPPQQITPPYQQSPPHMYPQTVPTVPMYGQPFTQQNLMSPPSQPYPNIYATQPQPQFQPHPHLASTYTTPSHPQHAPYTQPMTVTQQPEPVINGTTYTQVQNRVPTSNQTVSQGIPPESKVQNRVPITKQTVSQDITVENKISSARKEPDSSKNVTETRMQDEDGFFVTMHENSPRRQKTQISDQKAKVDAENVGRIDNVDNSVISETRQTEVSNAAVKNSYESSVIADFAQKIADKPPESVRIKEVQPDTSLTTDTSQISDTSQVGQGETESSVHDTSSVVGFVIGQDESMLDQSAELEMQKKKDKILQMRLRRQEEQELKRQKKEQEMQRKREAERLKQEEAERRKSEEKARREQIFRQYIEKKEEEEEGGPKKREEKSKQKPRPKSMFVRVGPGANLDDGLEGSASVEDLSARDLNVPAARGANSAASRGRHSKHPPSRTMRKAVSCNMLDQKPSVAGDGKSLAFGGLTHRRPPSPDLYNRNKKGQRSNESSESGSATGVPVGVDYTGPKLFVKPSAKSNRHIIINAISHCCLAGSVNTDQKNKVLEEIAKSNAKHFLILFRDASCGYRGLYGFDPDTEETFKLVGVGPRQITNNMIEKYYKYNSGAKSFSEVSSTKHVSVSIDALVLQNSVWKPTKAPAKGYR